MITDNERRLAEERILVLPATQRDGELTAALLESVGLTCRVCTSVSELAREIEIGVGAVVLTEDVADSPDLNVLLDAIDRQPNWSELPLVVSLRSEPASPRVSRLLNASTAVTLLERPAQMRSLLSAVLAALRARRRQYQIRAQMEEIRGAERERARLLESETAARAEAERANHAKDRFIAVLSHELRTPLTPVLTMVQLLERERDLPPAVREVLPMIRRNIELETRLIDDLLDITRIMRGKLQLQMSVVDVHEQLRGTRAIVESDARAKKVAVLTEFAAEQHHVRGDSARIQQIFWNVLKNAIKFTPEGGTVTVRTSNDGDRVVISCTDTGIGIAPDVLPRIFDAFEQGEKDVTRVFGGLGLGLAITKALVEGHGGTLTAHSEGTDRGSTFTISFPVTTPVSSAIIPAGSPQVHSNEKPPQRARVLLVEDHPDSIRVMSQMLEIWGYSVRTADSIASALQAIHAEHFDVLLCDIGLPDGSGLDLMRQLNGHNRIRGIALSGFGMEEDLRASREAGFDRHLTKPVNIEELEAAIAQLIQSEPTRGQPSDRVETLRSELGSSG